MPYDPKDPFNPGNATASANGPSGDLAQRFKKYAKGIQKSPGMKALIDFGKLPAEGVTALFGAPQRAVAAETAALANNRKGTAIQNLAGAAGGPLGVGIAAAKSPAVRSLLGNEVSAVLHPNDPNLQANAEKAVGVDKLKGPGRSWKGKLRNLAVDTAFQTATDPLTALPASMGEHALEGSFNLGNKLIRSPNRTVANAAQHFVTNVPERLGGFSRKAVSVVNTARNKAQIEKRAQEDIDKALLKKYAPELRNGQIPDALRQRMLQEPYVHGTADMREQAVSMGYRPSKAEEAVPPTGILKYNLRANYDPATGLSRNPMEPHEELLLGEEQPLHAPTAGFEREQTRPPTPETMMERWQKRLAQGRAVVAHRQVSQTLQDKLSMGKEMADSYATAKKYGGFKALQGISNAQKWALLKTGIPHMRNVGIAGYLSLGEKGLGKATQFFATGVPKALSDRLREGAEAHFGKGAITGGALDKWDNAIRAARLEQIDKEFPKWSPEEKLDRVNHDIGHYTLRPHFVSQLQGFGANFPQWHNYIVPTMAARAALTHPGRIARLARTEQNANDTFLPNSPYRVTLGGPIDEAASAVGDIGRMAGGKLPSYLLGPSSIGPASALINSHNQSLPERVVDFGMGMVPFGGTIMDTVLNPFNNKAPAAARAGLGMTGMYTQKRTPGSLKRTANQGQQAAPSKFDPSDPFKP